MSTVVNTLFDIGSQFHRFRMQERRIKENAMSGAGVGSAARHGTLEAERKGAGKKQEQGVQGGVLSRRHPREGVGPGFVGDGMCFGSRDP